MNDLITAAKAMVEWFDSITAEEAPIENLRAAVERAEKQEPIGFKRWCQLNAVFASNYVQWFESAWTAAQQAERERCREIVKTMGGPDVPELLRQIDSGEE